MVAGLCHSDSAVTVLDMGYTSTMLLISVSYIGYQTMCIPVAKKVPRYGQWDKSIAKELRHNGQTAVFILSHKTFKLFKVSCLCLFTRRLCRVNKY